MIIAVGQTAQDLDIFLRVNNVLTDPLSITYDMIDAVSAPVDTAISGFRRSAGHYDARNTTIPSGFDISAAWTITWTWTSPGGVTSQASENFTVVNDLVASFTNLDDIIEQIKLDLDLADDAYTDNQYQIWVTKALNRLNRKLSFTGTSAELSIDNNGAISPSPNSSLTDLILLQTECLIVKQIRQSAVNKGIRVKDGDSEIDTTAGFGGYADAVDGICNELDEAVKLYKTEVQSAATTSGAAQVIWYGNSRVIQNLDHNGEGRGVTRNTSSPFEGGSDTFGRSC